MWWCRCAVCLRCECERKTIFHTSSEGFPSSHQPSAVVDLLRPDFPSPDAQRASVVQENCRQRGSVDVSSQRPGVGCVDVSPLRCFSSAFIFPLHSKLSLRRLNSWKFHSEGVTHIFLQLRLFKRENIKGKLKAQGKLAKESWIKVECRESEGKFCVEKIIFRQVKVFVFGNFCEKTVKWKIQNSSNTRTGKRKSENKINCKAFCRKNHRWINFDTALCQNWIAKPEKTQSNWRTMSSYPQNSIKFGVSQERTDHSEKVVNKIKELVNVEICASEVVDTRDTGVILWN